MAIDSVELYNPKMGMPLYTCIRKEGFNDFKVGDKYDIRIVDRPRQEEKDGRGEYNYMHECILIAKRECTWGELEDITKAFNAKARDRDEVLERTAPGDTKNLEDDDNVILAVYLRLDKAREFIMSDDEVVDPPWMDLDIEDYEGNG